MTALAFSQHPLRQSLHDEVHARPAEQLTAPLAVSRLVMWCDAAEREASRQHLGQWLDAMALSVDWTHANHLSLDMGPVRLRWELHGEFVTYAFFDSGFTGDLHSATTQTALSQVPQAWLQGLPGSVVSANHLWVVADPTSRPSGLSDVLDTSQLMGSSVAEGAASVYSDFLIKDDGFSRFVLACTPAITPRRLGRTVIRLLEIETYRMVALLALPIARQVGSALARSELELAQLARVVQTAGSEDEQALLIRLTQLAGEVEGLYAQSQTRFTAAKAYFELVDRRILELREDRLPGLQTFKEFMDRRLSPARNTCIWAMHRQEALSLRVARVSDLLRTRVEMEQQLTSQALLTSLNQRQDLQIKMQATVEGLSVAAISYYMVGLVGYLVKGAQKMGWPINADLTAAAVVPVIVFAVWWSLRRLHQRIGQRE